MVYSWELFGIPISVRIIDNSISGALIGSETGIPADAGLSGELLKLWRGEHSTLAVKAEGVSESVLKVLRVVQKIPYGKVSCYRDVSKAAFGDAKHARLVGYALSVNPVPVFIPCHRVVHADGRVEGFTGKLEHKIKLLRIEGVEVKNGKIARSFFVSF